MNYGGAYSPPCITARRGIRSIPHSFTSSMTADNPAIVTCGRRSQTPLQKTAGIDHLLHATSPPSPHIPRLQPPVPSGPGGSYFRRLEPIVRLNDRVGW